MYARKSFSSLTTEDKISVASDENRAVCARLNLGLFLLMKILRIYEIGKTNLIFENAKKYSN